MQKSLKSLVKQMNKEYPGKIGDDFNLGVNKRVVPVYSQDGVLSGWKIQQNVGEDNWVDICNEVFNTMEELISRNKTESKEDKEKVIENGCD